ncbi:50S ribosomal protein L31 [Candidatus Woesebacteria bacterium RBG_19FT_COMBO_42_9]|uniref:50S ribosomal protein L31 n=1 Tax=Candidatus Woesebacteria bacterium RBG_16_42_24 TaxID=1802485 RepID=A0A1F7XJZ8_9BACT|nr:MAG: 50S ribosomal protein L31 [Candidatus Woesebacteria bacterium RBG_16_42_24]OGM16410.1 MAG: 50S ribosomal protein L31 [Candidatus Woesebacteria bacterium RBG_19FT_COMBO_42_9]OGM67346.1 MAG: 50S ribosomal protein L31 [Candidatus Woesebacteria bacterium RIFCSPLOWO2_01_FULL_43_11]
MKVQLHPTWYPEAKITCACGNSFAVGATVPEIKVEVCYNCHPFYTGQMKYVDTAGRVEAFKTRQAGAQRDFLSKAEKRRLKKAKRLLEEMERPDTLEALRTKQ